MISVSGCARSRGFNQAREWLEQHWGGLDVLVNNAGVAAAAASTGRRADWDWIFDINVKGPVRGCVIRADDETLGHGHIVNVASLAGLVNAPAIFSYNDGPG